jgi:hypothetical protein
MKYLYNISFSQHTAHVLTSVSQLVFNEQYVDTRSHQSENNPSSRCVKQ